MEYRIQVDEAIRVARIRAWKRAPRFLVVVVVVLSIFGVVNRNLPGLWTILLISLLVCIAAIAGSVFLSLSQIRKQVESYCLTVADNVITRNQAGLASASTRITDITKVERNKYDTLIVFGVDGKLAFGIPRTLEGLKEVVALLEDEREIGVSKTSTARRWVSAVSYLGLVLIPVFMFVRQPEIVFIAGILLAALLGTWGISTLRNKHTANSAKWMIGVAYVLIFAVLIIPGMIQAGKALFR